MEKSANYISEYEVIHKLNSIFQHHDFNLKLEKEHVEFFPSKKHYILKTPNVCFSETNKIKHAYIIIKFFNPNISDASERWNNELSRYNLLLDERFHHHFFFPQMLQNFPGILIRNYINGTTLQDLIIAEQFKDDILLELAHWYHFLHTHGLIFGDNRLTNFLCVKTKQLYIIDLEDITENEDFIEDFALLLCSFLDLTPGIFQNEINSYRFERMTKFLKSYISLNRKNLPKCASFENKNDGINFWVEKMVEALRITSNRRKLGLTNEYFINSITILSSNFLEYM